jgi:hypothetical protein
VRVGPKAPLRERVVLVQGRPTRPLSKPVVVLALALTQGVQLCLVQSLRDVAIRLDGYSMLIDSRIVESRTPIFWRMSPPARIVALRAVRCLCHSATDDEFCVVQFPLGYFDTHRGIPLTSYWGVPRSVQVNRNVL